MRAQLDENLPVDAAGLFRESGWNCETVFNEGLQGASDKAMLSACQTESRVLFTLDLDFADIRRYPPAQFFGIVVLRPAGPSREQILKLLARALPVIGSRWAPHRLWIIESDHVRIREAPVLDAGGQAD